MKKLIPILTIVFILSLLFSFQLNAATTTKPGVTLRLVPKYNLLACGLSSKSLFVYFNSSPRWLAKSIDGGKTWSTDSIGDGLNGKTLTALEMSPGYATDETLFAATSSALYQSTDGGETFDEITIKGLSGSITSMAVGPGGRVVLGARTGSSGGGVLLMDDGWRDLQIGEKDVYAVAFDPNYESNRSVFACTYDGNTVRLEGNSGASQWYSGALFTGTSLALQSAAIESSSDGAVVFVGLNGASSGSDLYKVSSSAFRGQFSVIDLNVNGRAGCDVQSVAMLGTLTNGHLAVGQADSNIVRFTANAGASTVTWNDSSAPPSGTGSVVQAYGQTYAALKSVPLAAPGTYYGLFAATSGTGFGISRSMDYGDTFSSIHIPDMTGPTTTSTSTSAATSSITTSTSSASTSSTPTSTTTTTPTTTTSSTSSKTTTSSTSTTTSSSTTTYDTGALTPGGPLFTITGLTVSKNTFSPGETVEVTATISNIGNKPGSFLAELIVNGKPEASQKVNVDPASQNTAKFNFTRNEEATYNLQVGDKTAEVSVVKSSIPPWWGFLIGIIVLLAIIFILIKIIQWALKK